MSLILSFNKLETKHVTRVRNILRYQVDNKPCGFYDQFQRVVNIDHNGQMTSIPLVSIASNLDRFRKEHACKNLENHRKRCKILRGRNCLVQPLSSSKSRKTIASFCPDRSYKNGKGIKKSEEKQFRGFVLKALFEFCTKMFN